MKTQWTVSDLTGGKSLLPIEIRDAQGEFHSFELVATPSRVVFGGACNAGFLESGYILREEGESLDETLCELLADLECYYSTFGKFVSRERVEGPQYVSRIVHNERM